MWLLHLPHRQDIQGTEIPRGLCSHSLITAKISTLVINVVFLPKHNIVVDAMKGVKTVAALTARVTT